MLTNEDFHSWCLSNGILPETETYIQRIRSSQPVRKVHSGISNVCGRYPSKKMGRTIQFESQHVELWGIYEMERDDDVLEYYDQPTRLQLRYRARSGRNTTQWHTPDFFVIRRTSAGFEEWKKASAAEGLTITMPERYVRRSVGGWQCPPGETVALKRCHKRSATRSRMAETRRVSVVTPGSRTFLSRSQAVARSKSTLGRSVPIQMRA